MLQDSGENGTRKNARKFESRLTSDHFLLYQLMNYILPSQWLVAATCFRRLQPISCFLFLIKPTVFSLYD